MKIFKQYQGLRREIYVLFFGRIVTNMGALIWPMMTLILSNKLGMGAKDIASILLIMALMQLPATLIGGKLADKFNKRNIIIFCDLVTVSCFIICSIIPISMTTIAFFFFAGMFAAIEWPCYDAIIADLTTSSDRERAYSLSYLGGNLGLVLSPLIGGLLFEHLLNVAFLINAISTLSSTILIFIYVKNVAIEKEIAGNINSYEAVSEHKSIFKVLWERKIIILFVFCTAFSNLLYSQFNFLLPLNMEQLYAASGAMLFGGLVSINAIVVIFFTPIITTYFSKMPESTKMLIGELLLTLGLGSFMFIQGIIPLYFVAMAIFTFGEIFVTIGSNPYMTKRIPSSHRGRVSSIRHIFAGGFQSISQVVVGGLVDLYDMSFVWMFIGAIGIVCTILYFILQVVDKKKFPLLYQKAQ